MRRALLLNGFMATGKSTVARIVAQTTGRPFMDLDQIIEGETGSTVERLFAERGEAAFRAIERDALERLLARVNAPSAPVIALGGGALLGRDLRLRALDQAVVVTLEATHEQIVERLRASGGRPLLSVADPDARVRDLLELRAQSYAEAHGRVTNVSSPEVAAEQVRAIWARDGIAVAAAEASYTVEIGRGIARERLRELVAGVPVALLVSDRTVAVLHGTGIEQALEAAKAKLLRVDLEPGEEHKGIRAVEGIWRAALHGGADRKSVFVALGGGVVSDVTGFAAATWMRGVRWIGVPTTLLSMVDASVGGKTGVDLEQAKNAVGAFWQPSAVLCDIEHLRTEPARGFVGALSEVVKTALIGDPELFALLEQNADAVLARDPDLIAEIVQRSVRVKARIVSFDAREAGLRATLNLGHTVGHALEAHAGYGRLTHGEAISLGLVAALRIGQRLSLTSAELSERVLRLLGRLGLPVDLAREPVVEAAALIGHDKKRSGSSLKLVVALDVGRVDTLSIPLEELLGHVKALAN